MKNLTYIFFLLLLSSCAESFYTGKVNSFDRDSTKTGLWITWWDEEKTIPMSKNFFRDGKVTLWNKVYHYNGNLAIKFKPRGDKLRVKYYDEYGQLSHKGWASFDVSEDEVHYYWHGKWKYFDTYHKLERIVWYKNGAPHVCVEVVRD